MKRIIASVVATIGLVAITVYVYKKAWIDATISTAILSAIATISAPFLVIFSSDLIAERKAHRDRKYSIFKTLMATRGDAFSRDQVLALNLIHVEFEVRTENEVIEACSAYQNFLQSVSSVTPEWEKNRREKLIELIKKIATSLDCKLNHQELTHSYCSPRVDDVDSQIKENLLKILSNNKSLKVQMDSTAGATPPSTPAP